MKRIAAFILSFFVSITMALAAEVPVCLKREGKASTESVMATRAIGDRELLARLVYAESLSTGFGDDPLVYESIAWGVMNRVRLGERSPRLQRIYGPGIRGVIFKKGQFNPAISPKSPFSKAFLCPDQAKRWDMAIRAADTAIQGAHNPFIQTPWERKNGLALVVNFYYPASVQAKGDLAPWEHNKSLRFIGDLPINGQVLPAARVRFYRLNPPPADLVVGQTKQNRSE